MPPDLSVPDVLATVNKRHDLLGHIVEGVRDRRELARRANSSKTTVYRGLDQLEEANLVMDGDGDYRPTAFGHWLFDRYDALFERTELAVEHQAFLQHLPIAVGPTAFSTGETVHSQAYDPQVACRALVEHVTGHASITAVTPTVQRDLINGLRDRLEAERLDFELVTSPGAASTMASDYEELFHHENCKVDTVESPPEIGLYRTEEVVALTALSDQYHVESIHVTDAEDVLTAVESMIDDFRAVSKPALREI